MVKLKFNLKEKNHLAADYSDCSQQNTDLHSLAVKKNKGL